MATEDMTEMDVREEIVRPFLHALGYKRGTANDIRTEVKLTYERRVLGRRKPKTDHPMEGRADYICHVVSYARWTVEAKASTHQLSDLDWEQAHSYACHPDIAASLFLVTNGRQFRLYSIDRGRAPILEWCSASQERMWVNIQNLLSPDQIRRRASQHDGQRQLALAPGLGSAARIVGGRLEYVDYVAETSLQVKALTPFVGLRATVEGDNILRNAAGLICARLRLAGPTQVWDDFNRRAGIEVHEFSTADQHLSTVKDRPTMLQGMLNFTLAAGTDINGLPGVPPGTASLPFDFHACARTDAIGYLHECTFSGIFSIEYSFRLPAGMPELPSFESLGDFYVNLA